MSSAAPTVCVLMAVHDGERYLREAIESVLAQTRSDFEFLIVDDGSGDATPEILTEYASGDERIVVQSVPHGGRSGALNFGCGRARADLVARIDADDLALPKRLELQLEFLEAHPDVALLGGGA